MDTKEETSAENKGILPAGDDVDTLSFLLETVGAIGRASELETLFRESMDAVCTVMGSEASFLMLIEEESGGMLAILPDGEVGGQIRGEAIPAEEGIGGWVVRNRKPYISNNPGETELFGGEVSPDFETHNVICVPLTGSGDQLIGVLAALNRKDGNFREEELPVFQALSSHIAQSIRRTRQTERLKNQLREQELLLKESHHRIKNNLSTLCALIEMEMPGVDDPKAVQLLRNTHARMNSITEVHDLVSSAGEFDRIDLGSYLRKLSDKIIELISPGEGKIRIKVETESFSISSEKAMYCGMILNELLVNVYKHAFGEVEEGEVTVKLDREGDGGIRLEVRDNGSGLPDGFDAGSFESHDSVGLWVIDVLSKKLDASLRFDNENGARVVMEFRD